MNHNHQGMNMNPTQGMNKSMDMGGHGQMDGMDMMMMKMYFHGSKKAVILFKDWSVDSVGGLFGSCVAIFVIAVLYEGLKVFRESLRRRYSPSSSVDLQVDTKKNGTYPPQLGAALPETKEQIPSSRICNWHHILQSLLHILQVAVSYCLMLIFMTYNVWLCLAVLLGAGFGYFIFGWKLNTVVDIYEHCH